LIVEDYEIPIEDIVRRLKQLLINRVLVQLPNGLKRLYPKIRDFLSAHGIDSVLSLRPTWGICDLAIPEAKSLGIKVVLHIGHHAPPECRVDSVRVIFLTSTYIIDPSKLVYRIVKELMHRNMLSTGSRVGLTCTIQHCKYLSNIIRELKKLEIDPIVSRSNKNGMMLGQVLGCDYSAATSIQNEVDMFICVAGGRFHALGLAATVDVPVIGIDPYMKSYFNASKELRKIIAQRLFILSKAMDANTFGIVLCSKHGQLNLKLAETLKERLKSLGFDVYLLVVDEVTPERLDNIPWVEAFVSTACPRLAFEDLSFYRKPVLNPGEVKYIIRRDLSTYRLSDSLIYSPVIS